MNTFKKCIKAFTVYVFLLGIFISCAKDDPKPDSVNKTPDDGEQIQKPATGAQQKDLELDYDTIDPKAIPLLNAYLEAYEHAVTDWEHKDNYDFKSFIIALSVGGSGKSKAVYLVLPPNHGYEGNVTDVVQTHNKPTDGTMAIRLHDPELRKSILQVIGHGWFTTYKDRYMAFNLPEETLSDVSQMTDFLIHEGFHFFPQAKDYKDPNPAGGQYRFNIPKHYPHDVESFSLMYAGHKIAELAAHTTEAAELREYAKMFHVILQRLKANDTSDEKLVETYYMPFQWVEGMTTYIAYHAIKNRSFYEADPRISRPFQEFESIIKRAIDEKITGTTIQTPQGIQTLETPYNDMVDTSAYILGAWLYGVLDLLGYDVFKDAKEGISIDTSYENYLRQNNIEVDDEAVLETIKTGLPDFDWEAVGEIMKEYVKLWDNPDSTTTSYTLNRNQRSNFGHEHAHPTPWNHSH